MFLVLLATSIPSSCADNVCWNDPVQNIGRHEREAGADGGPYELAEKLLLRVAAAPACLYHAQREGPVSFCMLYFC